MTTLDITLEEDAPRLLAHLQELGLDEVEIYRKEGRSRTTSLELGQRSFHATEEVGWAVRAGTARGSWLCAGTGALPHEARPLEARWPELDGLGLRLPAADLGPQDVAPATDLEAPLLGEGEALALLRTVERTAGEEMAGLRLLAATLEDGMAALEITNSHGLRAAYRQRVAVLHLWASWRGSDVRVYTGAREPRRLDVRALARRVADRLFIQERGASPAHDRGEVVIAPEPAAHLVRALGPLVWDKAGLGKLGELAQTDGRVGSERFTLVDDGGLPGGLLEAPCDGEGVATRRVVLVEGGRPLQALRDWREPSGGAWSGCLRRASYRQAPARQFTHLFLAPDHDTAPADLVRAVARGLYVVELETAPQIDFEADRFSFSALGFDLRGGRASAAVRGALVTGSLRALLHGLEAVGRDLRLVPLEACYGAPTLLVSGLETRPR